MYFNTMLILSDYQTKNENMNETTRKYTLLLSWSCTLYISDLTLHQFSLLKWFRNEKVMSSKNNLKARSKLYLNRVKASGQYIYLDHSWFKIINFFYRHCQTPFLMNLHETIINCLFYPLFVIRDNRYLL